jgi:hypothetical protein
MDSIDTLENMDIHINKSEMDEFLMSLKCLNTSDLQPQETVNNLTNKITVEYPRIQPLTPILPNDLSVTMSPPDTFNIHRKRKRCDRPIDLNRSNIAQRRKRDETGKFLKKEVVKKIEGLLKFLIQLIFSRELY